MLLDHTTYMRLTAGRQTWFEPGFPHGRDGELDPTRTELGLAGLRRLVGRARHGLRRLCLQHSLFLRCKQRDIDWSIVIGIFVKRRCLPLALESPGKAPGGRSHARGLSYEVSAAPGTILQAWGTVEARSPRALESSRFKRAPRSHRILRLEATTLTRGALRTGSLAR